MKKMVEYVKKQDISFATYKDYIRACEFLGLDLTEDKNLIPHDFRHWHDTRIDEYTTAKAMRDAEEKIAFYENFASIATKYLCLQLNGNPNSKRFLKIFIIFISICSNRFCRSQPFQLTPFLSIP